jgi:hypothetical protein
LQIQTVRIISNNICFGPEPLPDDEVEQHLTISASGRIWLQDISMEMVLVSSRFLESNSLI